MEVLQAALSLSVLTTVPEQSCVQITQWSINVHELCKHNEKDSFQSCFDCAWFSKKTFQLASCI